MFKNLVLSLAIIICGVSCVHTDKKVAKPTALVVSPLPTAIELTKAANAQALSAEIQKASNAASSIEAAQKANTNQPPSPSTTFIDKELGVALATLPPPDIKTALEVEKRRSAIMEGRVSEANKLYNQAQSEAEKLKSESESLKKKAADAETALVNIEKSYSATLEKNRAANQTQLDAAEKRANDAEIKAREEHHKFVFRSLVGLGMACILAGIVLAVITNGAMVMRSILLAASGAVCLGLAQLISNPWFDRIFGISVGLIVIAGGFYLYYERKDAITKEAYKRTVKVLDDNGAIKDEDGKRTVLGNQLAEVLNDNHKAIVDQTLTAIAVDDAKAAVKEAKVA